MAAYCEGGGDAFADNDDDRGLDLVDPGVVSMSVDSVPPARPPAPGSGAAQSSLPPSFSQLALTLESGRLATSGGARAALLKPNPYVEVVVDGKPPRRTDTVKATYAPKWNESMTLLVTPYSKLLLRIFDHSSFKRDALIGEATLDIFRWEGALM